MKVSVQRACVLVVGMHRSGTSAIAGSLRYAGIALGDDLLAPGEDNPNGYFEHVEAVAVDEALLDALDRRWDDIRPMPERWEQSSAAETAREAIKTLIKRSFAEESLFAIKDPRMCRVLPVWIDALTALSITPKILFVVRDPLEVSASISRRDGWSEPVAGTLWLDYVLDAELSSRGLTRTCITYDSFLGSPSEVLSRALAQLGLADAARQIDGADLSGFVSKDQRHHFGKTQPPDAVGVLARKVFSAFEMAENEFGSRSSEFDQFRMEFDGLLEPATAYVAGLSEKLLACRRASDALLVDLATRQTDLNSQLEWSKLAIEEREKLYTDLADAQSQLEAQKKWSEAAVEEREALQAQLAEVRSSLIAQQQWSDQSVANREALQSELADVTSQLRAQQVWAEEAVVQREALQAELANERSQLRAQQAWAEGAVAQRETLQAELADVRSQLLAQQSWAESAVAQREALQSEISDLNGRLSAQIEWSNAAVEKENQLHVQLHAEKERHEMLSGELASLNDALRSAIQQHEDLQEKMSRHESTWLGRLNRWYVGKLVPEDTTKETK